MRQSNNISLLDDNEIAPDDEDIISLSNILHVLWLRRRIFLAVFVFVVVTAIIIISQLVPKYTSESDILVGTAGSQVIDVDAVLTGNLDRWGAVDSEVEVIRSRGLARKVIEKLNLLNVEEFNPGIKETSPGLFLYLNPVNWISDDFKHNFKEALGLVKEKAALNEKEKQARLLAVTTSIYLEKLKTSVIRESQVIKLAYSSLNPKLASQIANTHAEMYIASQLDAKFDATEKATSWLNERLTGLRTKVEESERAVEIYRNEHGLSQGTGGVGLVITQLSEINSQLIIAKAEKAGAEARLRQMESLLKNDANAETASEVLASPLIQSLRNQEATLNRKVSEMAVEYGIKHPKMIRIRAEIKDLQDRIRREIRKIAAGLKNEVQVAQTRENSLRSSLKEVANQSGTNRKEEVQLRALEREAAANRTLFETFLNRFKETTSTQGMHEADARIISIAETPVWPSYPNTRMMFVLSVILALFIAAAVVYMLEMLNPGLRTPEDIERFLNVPAIGLIPTVENRDPFDYILEKPQSSFSEALNTFRVSLCLSDPDRVANAIQITSAVPEEGKSTLALCMARGAANSGQKVALVDADLRRPSIEKKLGFFEKTKGLTDLIMAHDEKVFDYLIKDEKSELNILPKGAAEYINPVDVFTSYRMKTIIAELKDQFDLIIFDTPPVMVVSDARALAQQVDKTVLVVCWDRTPRKVVKAAIQQLVSAESKLAGVVLQKVNLKQYGRYGYGDSGYYYHYGKYGQYYSG